VADPASSTPSGLEQLVERLRDALATPPAELLDLPSVQTFTAQSRASIYRGMAAGTFPRPDKTSSVNRWKRSDLLSWIQKLKSK
jgi:predicted DNA-binding transcriptional regulator AlpA